MTKIPCSCPCHVKAVRDIHVSPLTGAVLWCCHAPFAQPSPMVEPAPLFKITDQVVEPMKTPVGAIFHLDLRYRTKNPGQSGD